MDWPPDYVGELVRRATLEERLCSDPELLAAAMEFYATDPVSFVADCIWIVEPRNANVGLPTKLPAVPFPRQEEYLRWLHERFITRTSAPVEKSRDSGASWMACAFAVWLWLFVPGSTAGFGSRKEDYVDRLGDMDTLFEKMRSMIRNLPPCMLPEGLNEKQHFNHMRLINPANGATIKGEAGDNIGRGGRAQPLSAKILTPTGWLTMGDMKVGTVIVGANGKPTRVTGVFPQGVEPIYRVAFSDGSSTLCCASHLWRVTDHKQRKSIQRGFKSPYRAQFSVLSTAEIGLSLRVSRQDNQTQWRYQIPIVRPVEFAGRDDDLPLDPYVVGSLIGDGSIGHIHRNTPAITSGDEETFALIAERLPAGVSVRRANKLTARLSDDRGKTGAGVRSVIKSALIELGLDGRRSGDKFIPDRYKFASPAARLLMLQGLLDTDGWTSVRMSRGKGDRFAVGSKTGFCTTSPQLRDDVIFLVRSLGGTANYHVKPAARHVMPGGVERDCNEAYEITITMPAGLCPHLLKRKRDNHVERCKYQPFRSIVSVEYVADMEAQCISVDAEDSLYVTDDFIVTHNTSVYFVDESAFIERPKAVNAALSANTDTRIDISSCRAGTDFQARCDTTQPPLKFIFDIADAPWHTPEWIEKKRREVDEGTFAQEFLRDPTAAIEGQLIPSKYVEAAIDLHKLLGIEPTGAKMASLDVADGGNDRNAVTVRHGIVITHCESRAELLADGGGAWAYGIATRNGCQSLTYDSIGVGAGAAAVLRDKKDIETRGWSAAGAVVNPEGHYPPNAKPGPGIRKNKDMFANAKAQAWWFLKDRFHKTFKVVSAIRAGEPLPDDLDYADLIAISSEVPEIRELKSELSQVTWATNNAGKIVINKAPDGHKSPNRADSLMIAFAPARVSRAPSVETVGGLV